MIEHDAAGRRFVHALDKGVAYLTYERVGPDAIDLQHTVVPKAARGRGVGEALVAEAVRYARDNGLRIIPTCRFVRDWLEEHPEERDLVAK